MKHPHGTYSGYRQDGCRCDLCHLAKRRHDKRGHMERSQGIYRTMPVERVKAHIDYLYSTGMGSDSIAKAGGVSAYAVRRIRNGQATRTKVAVAKKLLTVEPTDAALVSSIGSIRRLRALLAIGWAMPAVAEVCGINMGMLQHIMADNQRSSGMVTRATHEAIRKAYDELSMKLPQPTTPGQKGIVTRSKSTAAKRGWVPPLAWDDGDLDDPNAKPYREYARDLRANRDAAAEKDEELTELLSYGFTIPELARMWKITPQSIERRLDRRGIERAA